MADRVHERMPHHDQDCLAGWNTGSPCRCPRGDWLDESVPRWRARAELLEQFERWAREQEIFTDADLGRMQAGAIPEMAAMGIRAAQGIGRALWQRIAVSALNQRQDMERRRQRQKPPAGKAVPALLVAELALDPSAPAIAEVAVRDDLL